MLLHQETSKGSRFDLGPAEKLSEREGAPVRKTDQIWKGWQALNSRFRSVLKKKKIVQVRFIEGLIWGPSLASFSYLYSPQVKASGVIDPQEMSVLHFGGGKEDPEQNHSGTTDPKHPLG